MSAKSHLMLPFVTLALVVVFIITVILFSVFKVPFYSPGPGLSLMFIVGLNFAFGLLWLADGIKGSDKKAKDNLK